MTVYGFFFSTLLHRIFPCGIFRLAATAFAGAALLAGCAVGPDFQAPQSDAPVDWTSWQGGDTALHDPVLRSNQGPVLPRWWQAFNDATLNQLLARAQTANPDLQTAALRFAQSRVLRLTVAAQHGPQVSAGAQAGRQRQSEHGAATRMIDVLAPAGSDDLVRLLSEPFNLYQAGFDASWELDLWGRVRRSIEAADADAGAAAAALDGVRLGIVAEVARNYFELRGLQGQVRLARADLSAAAQYMELIQARADGGMNSDLDATRQRALLAELRARLPQLLEQEARTINQLSLLLGERPGTLQAELAAGAEAPVAIVLPDLALGLPSELARRRPDIRQAEAKLHSATASIGVAVADLYPRITLGASFGLESIGSRDLGDWASRRWTVGPSLDLPLFDMGRRRSIVTLRNLQQQEAAVAYQQTVLKAWHEIDTALTAYTAERQRNQQLAEQQAQSSDAYRMARVRYKNGLTSFLDVLDAQRKMLAAQRDHAQSNSQLAIRLVVVHKALGAGDY